MPIDIKDVMTLLSTLSKEENLRVTVKQSVRGGVIAGLTTAMGGIIAGPPGLAIGGGLGGTLAYYLTNNSFKPAAQVILDMPKDQQEILYTDAMKVLNKLDYTDLVTLTLLVQGDALIGKQLVGVVMNHLKTNLNMEVLD